MPPKRLTADIQVSQTGPNGRPVAAVHVDAKTPIDQLSRAIQKNITRNTDLLKKVGLRACPACISGFDIWIRQKYDQVIQVELEQIG